MFQPDKARGLIDNFEKQEGLDPEKDSKEHNEVDASEFGAPGNTGKLTTLFGEVKSFKKPVQKEPIVTQRSSGGAQNYDDRSSSDGAQNYDDPRSSGGAQNHDDRYEDVMSNASRDSFDIRDDRSQAEYKKEQSHKGDNRDDKSQQIDEKDKKVDKKEDEQRKDEKKEEVKIVKDDPKVAQKQGTDDTSRPSSASKSSNKKVLIVYAHVFKESYEGSLVGGAYKALSDKGVEVQISNLYDMGFNPVCSPKDFGGVVKDKEFYSYSLSAGEAKSQNKLAQDIVKEQEKLEWADLLIVVSQLQSHGLSALLKGWFDRILTYNFAYSEGQVYEQGKLKGKRALLCLTTEALSSMYTPRGLHGDLNIFMWPILNGVLRFAGFDVMKPQVYFGAGRASEDYRDTAIVTLQQRLNGIFDEKPLSFIPTDKFDERDGFSLSDKDVADLDRAKGLTVGQHAGKVINVQLANIVEPEKRREQAQVVAKQQQQTQKDKGSNDKDPKQPWYTYW